MYAQDVITLKNGNEIKAKVEEISSTEIRYKRFENLQGPTIVITTSDVFFINYENGRREIISLLDETPTAKTMKTAKEKAEEKKAKAKATEERERAMREASWKAEMERIQRIPPDTIILKSGEKIEAQEIQIFSKKIIYRRYRYLNSPSKEIDKSKVSAIHYVNGRIKEIIDNVRAKPNFGIFFNPGGVLTYGVMVGTGFSISQFEFEATVSFPQTGLVNAMLGNGRSSGNIEFLVSPKYYTNRIKGGFYIGPFVGYRNYFGRDNHWSIINYNGRGVLLGLNTGYKFILPSGLYFRTGVYLGACFNIRDGVAYYNFDIIEYSDNYGLYRYSDVYQYWPDKGTTYFTPFCALDLTIGFNFLKVRR